MTDTPFRTRYYLTYGRSSVKMDIAIKIAFQAIESTKYAVGRALLRNPPQLDVQHRFLYSS